MRTSDMRPGWFRHVHVIAQQRNSLIALHLEGNCEIICPHARTVHAQEYYQ